MIEAERHRLIHKIVDERSIVSLSDLVDTLGVSEATVRRDINDMARRKEVQRIRGGVQSVTPRHETRLAGMPFGLSQSEAIVQKRAIARAAAALIENGDSIIITGGTTTLAMTEFLVNKTITILTNSLPIVTRLATTARNRVVIPGGTLYREQGIVLSPFEEDASTHFSANTLFCGCFGLNRFGLLETDPLVAQAEYRLIRRCEHLVVLADARKLRRQSSIVVAPLERVGTLITDDSAQEKELEPFRAAGIRVIVASAADESKLGAT